MPELPEVETVRKGLQKYVVGHKIQDVEILHPKIFEGDKSLVINSKITGARRVGKGLILDLDNKYSLAIHIKLTGQLVFRDKKTQNEPLSPKVGSVPGKFTHIIFDLDKDAKLYYNDMRRFGWIRVIKTDGVFNLPFFKDMGPEPFSDKIGSGQAHLSLKVFKNIVSKASTKIKPLIMDQKKIGGIGNIYANDALYKAGIDPGRPAKSLTPDEIKNLYNAVLSVMKLSLENGGASELSFVNILGQEGNYQNHTLIYGKTGQRCKKCGSIVKFFRLAGRGTYVCESCQH